MKFAIRQCIKMLLQAVVLPFAYFLVRWQKIDKNLIIFADAHHDSVPESMKALLIEIKNNTEFTVIEYFHDYQKCSQIKSLIYSITFMKIYTKAGHVIICDNFLPVSACRKKKDTYVFQLWHACGAFKKFGYDTSDDIPKYYNGNVFKNYDTVCVSGNSCVVPFTSAMNQEDGVVKPIGIPRTDLLFDSELQSQYKQRFLKKYKKGENIKIALWAPTFRGTALSPFVPGIDEIANLQEKLGKEWLVVSKLHPHVKSDSDKLFTASDFSADEILFFADILISDYSSIIFDYSVFLRPIIFWVPDLEEYSAKRGFYLNYSSLPGKIVTDGKNLADAVLDEFENFNKAKMQAFSTQYMSACDGTAVKKITDIIMKNRNN